MKQELGRKPKRHLQSAYFEESNISINSRETQFFCPIKCQQPDREEFVVEQALRLDQEDIDQQPPTSMAFHLLLSNGPIPILSASSLGNTHNSRSTMAA